MKQKGYAINHLASPISQKWARYWVFRLPCQQWYTFLSFIIRYLCAGISEALSPQLTKESTVLWWSTCDRSGSFVIGQNGAAVGSIAERWRPGAHQGEHRPGAAFSPAEAPAHRRGPRRWIDRPHVGHDGGSHLRHKQRQQWAGGTEWPPMRKTSAPRDFAPLERTSECREGGGRLGIRRPDRLEPTGKLLIPLSTRTVVLTGLRFGSWVFGLLHMPFFVRYS